MPTTEQKQQELEDAITDESLVNYFGILYADFGKRKTTTAIRCARTRACLLHADRGWHVYKNHDDTRDKCLPVRYDGLSQIPSLVDAIVDQRGKFEGCDLLILDTGSQMQELYIDFLLQNANYGGKYRDQLVAKQGKKFQAIDVPAPVDYHVVRNAFRPIVEALVKAPLDVLVLTHVREPGPMDKSMLRRPNLTESTFKVFARDATFIGYMNDKGGNHEITFKSSPTLCAKSQIPTLKDTIKTEELPEILWRWKERN